MNLPDGFKLQRRYNQIRPRLGPVDKQKTAGSWILETPIGWININRLNPRPIWRLSTALLQPSGEAMSEVIRWLHNEGLSDAKFATRRDAIITVCDGMIRSGVASPRGPNER